MNYKELVRRKAEQEGQQIPLAGNEAEALQNQESNQEFMEPLIVPEYKPFIQKKEQQKPPTQTKEKIMETTTTSTGHDGYGYGFNGISPLDEVIANSVNNLRAEVGETKATIKDSIHQQSLANGMEFCGLNKNILQATSVTQQQLANVERDLQNRIHEGMRQTQTSANDTNRYLSEKSDVLREKLANFVSDTAENFCTVRTEIKDSERRITDKLCATELNAANARISELLSSKCCDKTEYNFGLQNQRMNYFEQTLGDSVKQNQKFMSKVTQFGTGNVSTPTQTANQG